MEEALSQATGHPAPFEEKELREIRDVAVKYASDTSVLRGLGALEIVILVGCDPVDINDLRRSPELGSVVIRDSGLISLVGAGELPMDKLTLPRNFIEDIEPLLGIKQQCEIDLTGNPLSETSYREVLPELSRRGHRVKASGELPWLVTRRLHSAGVPVSCYRSSHGYRLCRPGLALTESPDYDHPVLTREQVEELMAVDPSHALTYFERSELVPRLLGP
ncbi:hypothetical protein [Streptomyces griseus]|uniref:hypothetical protein n=1 Tax=Streptomyces griseus TaxID=1911 RepID=UPI00131AE64F|nr:hypothetical protein [Streptomyces griseus]